MIHISFSALLNLSYFKALSIVKKERPELWNFFCKKVLIFPAVSNCCLIAIMLHISYICEIWHSVGVYKKYWAKYALVVKKRLDELFGYRLLRNRVTAYVCVTPLYIRNIKKSFFLVPINAERKRILNIIIHELSHFYCYQGYQMYGYEGEDAWELSEYLVPYMMCKYFSDICHVAEESYIGKVPEKYNECIKRWIEKKINFAEMLFEISAD